MTTPVRPCAVPIDSEIARLLPGADFHDAYEVEVDRLMGLRNRVVALFGLKHLGPLSLTTPGSAPRPEQPGDRVGIFTLRSRTDDEVLVEDNDKHLRVVLSLKRRPQDGSKPAHVVLTTVVHQHNFLGRLYMLPVAPMRQRIAPAVLGRINQSGTSISDPSGMR